MLAIGSGGRPNGWFRRVLESSTRVGVGSGGRVRKVPDSSEQSRGRVRKVLESSGVVCCLATLTGAAM